MSVVQEVADTRVATHSKALVALAVKTYTLILVMAALVTFSANSLAGLHQIVVRSAVATWKRR